MPLQRGRWSWLRAGLCALCLTTVASFGWAKDEAPDGPLSSAERVELLSGGVVERPLSFEDDRGRYVGGVSYQLVKAEPAVVLGELSVVDNLPHMLPFTLEAQVVDRSATATFVELTQGKAPFVGSYTVQVVREPGQLSFWLDRDRPSSIQDLWGYFRVQPFEEGTTLLTVAVALDLGAGVTRWLFEDRIQRVALSTPGKIRHFVERRVSAQRPAVAAR